MWGDGFVYREKKSPYYWCSYNLNGKRIRESTEETEEKKAEKYLRNRLKQVFADEIGARKFVGPSSEKVTVNELLDDLEANYRIRNKYSPQFASRCKVIHESLGKVRAKILTEAAIDRWIARLQKTCTRLHRLPLEKREFHKCDEQCKRLSPAPINRYTQILGQALSYGIKKIGEAPKITWLEEENARQ